MNCICRKREPATRYVITFPYLLSAFYDTNVNSTCMIAAGMGRRKAKKTNGKSYLLPEIVMDKIFAHLDLRDFVRCMLVCKYWYGILKYENTLPWRKSCRRIISEQSIATGPYSTMDSPKTMLRSYCHGWNDNVCSMNIHVKPDGLTIFHNLVPYGLLDGIHAKVGYSSGVHVWEIAWTYGIGAIEMVGVSTSVDMNCFPRLFFSRIGKRQRMWGWEMRKKCLHRKIDIPLAAYPKVDDKFNEKDFKIQLVLDLKKHQLLFERNNASLGIAFSNLPKKTKLYPFLLCYESRADVTIIYIGERRKKAFKF